MAHKLREISIAGYKSIRDARVELRDINILIGANGAGKSNLVSAFGLLHDLVEGQLGIHGLPDALRGATRRRPHRNKARNRGDRKPCARKHS